LQGIFTDLFLMPSCGVTIVAPWIISEYVYKKVHEEASSMIRIRISGTELGASGILYCRRQCCSSSSPI